jgi:tetratricopeptide (TPR) repeat protein
LPSTIQIHTVENIDYETVDAKHKAWLKKGEKILKRGEAGGAILNYFNPVITDYRKIYASNTKRIYTARTEREYNFYLMTANNEQKTAHILSEIWSEAYYLKAYALLELKDINKAQSTIKKALSLAPSNSKYLSELGLTYKLQKDWKKALITYSSAEKSAKFFTPKNLYKEELLQAKRGIGYSLIELKEMNKAEKVYREILKISPKDKIAQKELNYILELKKRR